MSLKKKFENIKEDNDQKNNTENKNIFNLYNKNLILQDIFTNNSAQLISPISFNNHFSSIVEEKKIDVKFLFSQKNILQSFNSQKLTRYLQKNLINISKEMITYIINELRGNFRDIIKNKNGNYFCSNIIKICDKENRIKILRELSDSICDDCTDSYGKFPIQHLIELASGEDEFKLILSSFKDYNKILLASLNQHGTYVIQKIIRQIPEQQRIKFNIIFVKFVVILSRNTYGVYALETFICNTKNDIIQKQILSSIMTNFVNIATNKSGNYLIQCLLEKWWKNKKGETLKSIIISKYEILSKNEYSIYICNLFVKLSSNEEKKDN